MYNHFESKKALCEQQDHIGVYTQAVGLNKRAAQSKAVRVMIPDVGQKAGEMDPEKAQAGV